MTVVEAVERYELSRTTLHRLLSSGKLPNAHKIATATTPAWRISSADIEALGYVRREGASTPKADLEAARQEAAMLRSELTRMQTALSKSNARTVACSQDCAM